MGRYPKFLDDLSSWDNIVTLAVAIEPLMFTRIFGQLHYPSITVDDQLLNEKSFRQHRSIYYRKVVDQFREINLDQLEQARRQLCLNAEMLDPNNRLHILLRLSNGEIRLKLEGQVGGAMHLLTMAEMLRRVAEEVFGCMLPEEDELGFGWWPEGRREQVYGTRRLLDGNRSAANEFLRHQFSLDFREKVHWYVEGETEYAGLHNIFGKDELSGVTVINLRGQVVQRGARGIAFRDSLRDDIRHSVFSFVSLDSDAPNNIRMLQRAADADDFFGYAMISTPDFEFGNFELEELEEVLWDIASASGANLDTRILLHEALQACTTGKELMKRAERAVPELAQQDKGEVWGEKLMKYALEHPTRTNGSSRPIVKAVQLAYGTSYYHYRYSRMEQQIDTATWQMVPRTRPLPGTSLPDVEQEA